MQAAIAHVQMVDSLPSPPYPREVRARGWRFEFDTERIRSSDTWAIAEPALRPWLLMLWVTAWDNQPVGLPGDERAIAGQIGMPLRLFQKHRDVLLRGWKMHDDGRLYHAVLTERVLEMAAKRVKDAERMRRHRDKERVSSPEVTRDIHVTSPEVRHPPPTTETSKAIGRSAPEFPPGFIRFWNAYPTHSNRRKNRAACLTLWKRLALEGRADELLAHVEAMKRTKQWQPDAAGESFEPEVERYLRKRNWEDGMPNAAQARKGVAL